VFCITIAASTLEDLEGKIKKALIYSDLLEIRVDFLESPNKEALKRLLDKYKARYIFTFRSKKEGGAREVTSKEQLDWVVWALQEENRDTFFLVDFEWELFKRYCKTLNLSSEVSEKVLLSYHNFSGIVDVQKANRIFKKSLEFGIKYCKLIGMARDLKEALHSLDLVFKGTEKGLKVVSFSMGEKGKISRILSLLCGSPFTYVVLRKEEAVAPGQLFYKEAFELLRCLKNFIGNGD